MHKTNLTTSPLFYWMPVPSQESERWCICVLYFCKGIDFATISTIWADSVVWLIIVFHFILQSDKHHYKVGIKHKFHLWPCDLRFLSVAISNLISSRNLPEVTRNLVFSDLPWRVSKSGEVGDVILIWLLNIVANRNDMNYYFDTHI